MKLWIKGVERSRAKFDFYTDEVVNFGNSQPVEDVRHQSLKTRS